MPVNFSSKCNHPFNQYETYNDTSYGFIQNPQTNSVYWFSHPGNVDSGVGHVTPDTIIHTFRSELRLRRHKMEAIEKTLTTGGGVDGFQSLEDAGVTFGKFLKRSDYHPTNIKVACLTAFDHIKAMLTVEGTRELFAQYERGIRRGVSVLLLGSIFKFALSKLNAPSSENPLI